MSDFVTSTSCFLLLHNILLEKERLNSHPSVHFCDCKRLCTRCEYFSNVATLSQFAADQLSSLHNLLEKILGFVKIHTNRPNYYQMTRPSARRSYVEVLAVLNEEIDQLRKVNNDSMYNRRQEDLKDYEETFHSLVMCEMEEVIQKSSEDYELDMTELEQSIAANVENIEHYLSVSKLPALSKHEYEMLDNNLKNMSIQLSIRRENRQPPKDDNMNNLIGALMYSDDTNALPSRMEIYRSTQLEGFRKTPNSIQLTNLLLGSGGFGEVFVGAMSNCEVAIKVMKNINHIKQECEIDQVQLKCIENEILLMAHVASPCVLSVYGYIIQPRAVFMIMELSSYGALSTLLKDRMVYEKLFPWTLCISWFLDIVSAIDFIHGKLIQHRDIKPDNLLLFPGLKLKLTDFGLAKERLSSVSTNTKSNITVAGSGAFMAPEIRMGSRSEYASDIFSFGVTVTQILSRKNPQVSNTKGQFEKALGFYKDSPTKTKIHQYVVKCFQYDESLPLNILRPSASFLSTELQSLLLIEQSVNGMGHTTIVRHIEAALQNQFQARKKHAHETNKQTRNLSEINESVHEMAKRLRDAEEGRNRAEAEAKRLRDAEEGRNRAEAEAKRLRDAEEGRNRAEAEAKRLKESNSFYFDNDFLQQAVKLFVSNKSQAVAQFGPIGSWNTSRVTNMGGLFRELHSFNEDISGWDVSNVTNMTGMFYFADTFNQPLNKWNVSNVTDMTIMFTNAKRFNQPLEVWNVSKVTNMRLMFNNAASFNQSLASWNVSNVTDMHGMFVGVSSFNHPLNNWNVSNVTDMGCMFMDAASFNQPLSSWNVSKVTNMYGMFCRAKSFNQPLVTWSVSSTTDMGNMFLDAVSFGQSKPSTKR